MTTAERLDRVGKVSETLAAQMARPYAYGVSDCFVLALAAVDAIRGTKHGDSYAGTYSTLWGAQRALRRRGHNSLVGFFLDGIGLEAVPASRAAIGDVAIAEIDGAEHAAIFAGTGFIGRTADGLQTYRLDQIKAAFRV